MSGESPKARRGEGDVEWPRGASEFAVVKQRLMAIAQMGKLGGPWAVLTLLRRSEQLHLEIFYQYLVELFGDGQQGGRDAGEVER